MAVSVPNPTPYPEVNALLHELLSGVQAILGEHLLGMYLDGSLATGDFDLRRSDVDFLVATDAALPSNLFKMLQAMHARIATSGLPLATELEGSYIPKDALRRYDPTQARHPRIEREGRGLHLEQHASDWVIHRSILRECGIALLGPAPSALIDPVAPDDLRRAVAALVREWWAPMRADPVLLRQDGYRAYAVLTMCRVLYTLASGTVVSKPVAARWAQQGPGERWAALIERALTWPDHAPQNDLNETLDLIQYVFEQCQPFGQ
jgi:hypothetical protein